MGWVQTGFLFALAAAAIPVLIHLLSRRQTRRIELGTMRFLQEVIHDSAHRRRIRRLLLLAARVGLVSLLGLLFARPFLPDTTIREGGSVRLVLVDRSAGMAMPGRSGRLIDDAVTEAARAVEQSGGEALVQWAWFDSRVEPLAEGTSRPEPPRLMAGHTDYAAALSWARDWFASRRSSDAELILATDLQQSGMTGERLLGDGLHFPREIPVRVLDVGRAAVDNLAVVHVDPGATRLPAGIPAKVTATLFKYGPLPAEQVPITATATDGTRTVKMKKLIDVGGDQAGEVAFDFGKLDPGVWRVTVDVDVNDDLAIDNRRVTAFEVADPIDVLVIDSAEVTPSAQPAGYYLAAALKQGSMFETAKESTEAAVGSEAVLEGGEDAEMNRRIRQFTPRLIDQETAATRPLAPQRDRLVVVSDAGQMAPQLIDRLADYVRRGGRLLVFAGEAMPTSLAGHWDGAGLSPGRLIRSESTAAMPFRITSVSARGSMLQPFQDPQHGDLGRLAFQSLTAAETAETTTVHARFDSQRPAITDHALGDGRVVWFLSSADDRAGNWTTSPLYLPLVHQMAADLLDLTGEGSIRFRSVGDEFETGAATAIRPVSREASAAVRRFERPGFEQSGRGLYVVNTPAKESDPARVDAERFVRHFGLTLADGDGPAVAAATDAPLRRELWPWLAAALLVLLVVEFCLANRTPA